MDSECKQSQCISMLGLIVGRNQTPTFLLGECMTGAGGDGGPRGIFLLILLENTNIEFLVFPTHYTQSHLNLRLS